MAVATREQIMDALLAMFRADSTCAELFPTISRRFLGIEQIVQQLKDPQPIPQPALFLFDGMGLGGGIEEHDPRGRSNPKVTTLWRTVVIYARLPGGTTPGGPDVITPGGTVFHPLIEAVEQALVPDSESAVTLGGLVSHCWLQGHGLIMTGEIDPVGQGMVAMPIRIMMLPSL